MRQSTLFTKTRREAPKDEVAKNAQLLIRAGYIHKEMAGVYDFLPLGLRTLNKIIGVIREEMNAIGGQEILMSSLQRKELWETTDRWDDSKIDNWFKVDLKHDSEPDGSRSKEVGLAFTHEEPITNMMEQFIPSYKDLPKYVYQFQTKFRNEKRAKSGIMRTREFIMKDMYSFSRDEEQFREFYEQCAKAYQKIFSRVGLGDKTFRTFASGGVFSKFSDEFQTVCDAGEDTIYIDRKKNIAVNKEVCTDEVLADLGLSRKDLEEAKAIEVGNIFPLSTRFSKTLLNRFKDEAGSEANPYMGSYGIGPARLMGTIVEVLSDDKGIVWPREVAPFPVHLVSIAHGNKDIEAEADHLYDSLKENGIEALYDDRDVRAGEKFADADLIGIPTHIVISEKTVAGGAFEVVDRATGTASMIPESSIIQHLKK
ncbi:prolyl-tRNA synthetase [Candidatus Kaiserbacteria bacterium]|nr:prolyl-tRNA synthetase [Candidatus Kaiserbacteria bacterium]